MKRSTTKLLTVVTALVVGTGVLTSCTADDKSSASSDSSASSGSSAKDIPRVSILNLANVPALTDIVDGITSGLEAEYGAGNIKIDSQNANGDAGVAQTIAEKFVADKPDAIATVATASLQAVLNKTKDIPVAFSAVSDPVTAGAVKSKEGATGTNVTGIYNVNPIGEVLDLTKEMVPDNNKVGVLYNPGEDNSVTEVDLTTAEAKKRGLQIVKATVTNSNDVKAAAESLVGKVGSIVIIADTTVVTGAAAVFQVARPAHLPVFTTVQDVVEQGAVVGSGSPAKETGELLATMIIKVLKGTPPGEVPLVPTPAALLFANQNAAKATGFTIPDSVLSRATLLENGK